VKRSAAVLRGLALAERVPTFVEQIVADDQGFVAIGRDYGGCCAIDEASVDQLVWLSADGDTWQAADREAGTAARSTRLLSPAARAWESASTGSCNRSRTPAGASSGASIGRR
jgi:hypothetical protein